MCRTVTKCNKACPGIQWDWQIENEKSADIAFLLAISQDVRYWTKAEKQLQRGSNSQSVHKLHELSVDEVIRKTRRIQALCIGIDEYKHDASGNDRSLSNCSNDAELFKIQLDRIDSEVVLITGRDLTSRSGLVNAFSRFEKALKCAWGVEIVICYIAGHAFQIDGKVFVLPSDFEFEDESMATLLALPLQPLVAKVQNALNGHQDPACLFLIDCCRTIPENCDRRLSSPHDTMHDFNQQNGMCIFSCYPGQHSPDSDEIASKNSPFAYVMADELFKSGGGITDAVHKAMLELGSHHKLRVDVRGLIDPKISLMGSNKMILRICCDIKPVATILTKACQEGSDPREDATSSASTEDALGSFESEQDEIDANEGACVTYNRSNMDLWQEKMKILVESIKGAASTLTYPRLLICNFMRRALIQEKDKKFWLAVCQESQGCKMSMVVEYFREFITGNKPGTLKPPLSEIVITYHSCSSGSNPVTYVLNEYIKLLLCEDGPQLKYWEGAFDHLVKSNISESDFMAAAGKVLDTHLVFDEILEKSFAYHGSFTAFFKVSRLQTLMLFEILQSSSSASEAVHSAGFRCFFSSFREFRPFCFGRPFALSRQSDEIVFRALRRIGKMSDTEIRVLRREGTILYPLRLYIYTCASLSSTKYLLPCTAQAV